MQTDHDNQQSKAEFAGVSFYKYCPHCGYIMRVYPDPNAPEDIIWECRNCDCEGE